MPYCIGLDCGIASVGFAVLELDKNEQPCRIIRLGSRIFAAAEQPKTGASLAAPRREARGVRRRLRRHRHRNERIRLSIIENKLLTEDELSHLFENNQIDIYQLRFEALDRCLTQSEFARVLIHIAQRRGFKSNRKADSSNKENGKLLTAVSENDILMKEKGYRTLGEMIYRDEKFLTYKRNKSESYSNTFSRNMVENEIHFIFSTQRVFGNKFASEDFERQYADIVLSQRSFEEGPGGDSKYGGNQIDRMIGNCTLIPQEKRAVKASYSFQLFSLWQNINNIRIIKKGASRQLTDNERKRIFNLAHEVVALTYGRIRKELPLDSDEFFAGLTYRDDKEKTEKAKFEYLNAYHDIRKVLDKVSKNRILSYSHDKLNEIGRIFTVYKNDETIKDALEAADIESCDIEQLLNLPNFSKVGHISIKACEKLIPFLEKGMRYNEACDAAEFSFKAHDKHDKKYLPGYAPELTDICNPVVRRAVSQTIKVVNAIVRDRGEQPMYINIELARELSKSFSERDKIKKTNDNNREVNEKIKERITAEFGKPNATGMDIVKLKLWEAQDGICPYSQRKIDLTRLFEIGYVEIDHIIPYSISFDDSYKNKVLVFSAENRNKGNRLPLQYLTGEKRDGYIVWVQTNIRDFRKKQIMLKESISDDDLSGFKERNLQDTKYLSRFLYNYINDYLSFAESKIGRRKRVTAVNGAVTAYMRKRWGIAKIREDGDLHHAADAVVVACVTDGMIRRISSYSNYHEIEYMPVDEDGICLVVNSTTGEAIDRFPMPWQGFRKELEIRLLSDPQKTLEGIRLANYTDEEQNAVKPCFVSRMPTRKTKGAAHKDTIRGSKTIDGIECVVTKTELSRLTLDENDEIENYYNPTSDRRLYEALVERLKAFGGDGKKAFAGDTHFRKPTKNGEPGPIVRKVKTYEKSSLNVAVNGGKGVAANDSMIRIDMYYVENDGYYFVPIYVADTVKPQLPNKAVVAGKSHDKWKEMDDKDFIFSLYPNDLIKVKSKSDIKMSLKLKDSTLPEEHIVKDELLYYVKAGISSGSITVNNHDGSYLLSSLGVKTLLSIEKFEVDVLGETRKCGYEKRQVFAVK